MVNVVIISTVENTAFRIGIFLYYAEGYQAPDTQFKTAMLAPRRLPTVGARKDGLLSASFLSPSLVGHHASTQMRTQQ